MESEHLPLISSPQNDQCLSLEERKTLPRPDFRNSPENMFVDENSSQNFTDQENEEFLDKSTGSTLNRNLKYPTSNIETMILLIKSNIGTGILAMPDAFKNAGLLGGLFGTLILGFISTHCMHLILKCSRELCQRLQVSSLTFSMVCYSSFNTGSPGLRKYADHVRVIINLFLIITQIGFCCVYFVFVAVNIQEVVAHYWMKLDIRIYLLLLLIPMIFMNLVKNLKYLTPFSFISTIFTISGLIVSYYFMLQDVPSIKTVNYFASWSQLPLYFGTAIYAFEGIAVVLPLKNNMKNPEHFAACLGILNTCMIIVTCLYTSVGFFGYLKYGDSVRGSITLNLGNNILAQSVKLTMAIAIFLSYPIQFYIPINIISPWLQANIQGDSNRISGDYLLRIGLVLFTFILAAMIPNLGSIISLVGAISSSALALIFPPIIEIVTFWPNDLGKYKWMLFKDIAIIVFGIMGFVFGSFTSIMQILHPEMDTK